MFFVPFFVFVVRVQRYFCSGVNKSHKITTKFTHFFISNVDIHTLGAFLVRDNRVFNGPLGRSLRSFARNARSAALRSALLHLLALLKLMNIHVFML